MAEGQLFKRDDALNVAIEVLLTLDDVSELHEITGSLRRQAVMVHDVDIVIIPKAEALKVPTTFGSEPISPWDARIKELIVESEKELKGKGKEAGNKLRHGPKIISFVRNNIPVDIYVATEENYECLLLIRTGSAIHNTKLATIAKENNWQLKASGEGLVDLSSGKTIATGEKEILELLLGEYPEPEARD